MIENRDRESAHAQGQILIRRFTDELAGTTTLEKETIVAQKRLDKDEETGHMMRMRSLYDDRSEDSAVFDSAEVARNALKDSCERYFAQTPSPAKESRFRLSRPSAKSMAETRLCLSVDQNFSDVTALVYGLETEWKEKHSKVFSAFKRVCQTLASHESVFTLFPSQSLYASIFCGSLSVLLKAAVNHDAIAETLSRTLSDISRKVAGCAKLLHVIKTRSMKIHLADVYTHMFNFFRDMMEWYLSSRTSRFFKSFNENVNTKFKEVANVVKDRIEDMYKEGGIGALAMLTDVGADVQDIKAEVFRQRQQAPLQPQDLGFDVGNCMRHTLISNFEEVTFIWQGLECKLREYIVQSNAPIKL